LKNFQGNISSLKDGSLLLYDKRTKSFSAGQNLMEVFYWHNKEDEAKDKIAFEKVLSLDEAKIIAQIAANIAGLEISAEEKGNLFIFHLHAAQ
jgi:hypothetical protein